MIYTSYFANAKKKFNVSDCVAICLNCPFWTGDIFWELAPESRLLHWWKSLSPEEQETPKNQAIYEVIYRRDVLSHLKVDDVYRRLDDKILLCFEKSTAFCHRHIVAKWFRENGYECEEL